MLRKSSLFRAIEIMEHSLIAGVRVRAYNRYKTIWKILDLSVDLRKKDNFDSDFIVKE